MPPNQPGTTDPDLDNFPAPPLFVLGRVVASAEAGYGSSGTTGITGNGKVSDGLGDSWAPEFHAVPGRAPTSWTEDTRRGILAGGGGLLSTFTLGPNLEVHLVGTGTSGGYGGGSIQEYLLPITLSSPDVFKRPDTLGDGGNQYVYGGDQPDGYLSVPGAVTVTGGDQSDAQWLVDNSKVDLKVESGTIPHALTHGWSVAGSHIMLDTSYTDENGDRAYSYAWVFKGLPDSNSDFGNHEVNLYVGGSKSDTAHIQTFYAGTVSNYPGAYIAQLQGSLTPPNWYNYYNQFYAATGDYEAGLPSYCENDYILGDRVAKVHVKDDAYTYPQLRIFGFDCDKSPFLIYLVPLHGRTEVLKNVYCKHDFRRGHA